MLFILLSGSHNLQALSPAGSLSLIGWIQNAQAGRVKYMKNNQVFSRFSIVLQTESSLL